MVYLYCYIAMYIITPKNDSGKVRVRVGKLHVVACSYVIKKVFMQCTLSKKENSFILLSNNIGKPSVYI